VPVDGDSADSLLKLIDALEDNDDVQVVSSNFEISDEILAKLTA
jgi:transcriptional/translational regulatory protein YebC/TACO1